MNRTDRLVNREHTDGYTYGTDKRMHDAWTKAVMLRVTLWTGPYTKAGDW
jgi:hypothetical protein